MQKELYEALKNLEFEKVREIVESDLKSDFYDSCNSSLQGWYSNLLLHSDGSLSLTGVMSQNSMTMSQYEGDSVCIFALPSYYEIDFTIVQDDDVNDLKEEDRNKLYDYLYSRYHDFDSEEKEDLWDLIDESGKCLDYIFSEALTEIFNKLELLSIDCCWEQYYDYIIDSIYDNVDEFIRYYEYKEM